MKGAKAESEIQTFHMRAAMAYLEGMIHKIQVESIEQLSDEDSQSSDDKQVDPGEEKGGIPKPPAPATQ